MVFEAKTINLVEDADSRSRASYRIYGELYKVSRLTSLKTSLTNILKQFSYLATPIVFNMAESKLHNTYAITGIPVKNVETKTKDIPYAPGTPIRREINELFPSEDPLTRKQWTLFILGLEKFKKMPVDERESYFQVAGIHGYPQTSWDGAPDPPKDPDWNPPKSKPWGANPYGGYCHHNTIAFPTWHRPYMLLYEVGHPHYEGPFIC